MNALEPILGFVSISRNLQRRVRSVGQRSAGAVDSNTDTADQVAHADKRAAPEKGVSGVVVAPRVCGVTANLSQLGGEDDAHDDSVDGDDLAENNRDQVLGADSWRLDTTTEDRSSGNEDSPVFLVSAFVPSCSRFRSFLSCRWFVPCGSNNGQADTEADACGGPGVGRNSLDERANLSSQCQIQSC